MKQERYVLLTNLYLSNLKKKCKCIAKLGHEEALFSEDCMLIIWYRIPEEDPYQ
jgi:hypothetical protein